MGRAQIRRLKSDARDLQHVDMTGITGAEYAPQLFHLVGLPLDGMRKLKNHPAENKGLCSSYSRPGRICMCITPGLPMLEAAQILKWGLDLAGVP